MTEKDQLERMDAAPPVAEATLIHRARLIAWKARSRYAAAMSRLPRRDQPGAQEQDYLAREYARRFAAAVFARYHRLAVLRAETSGYDAGNDAGWEVGRTAGYYEGFSARGDD